MSALSAILNKKQNETQLKTVLNEDMRAAQVKAAQDMAERLGKLVSANPDMTVIEFGALWQGALKAAGHKVLATEFVKVIRMLQVKAVNPMDEELTKLLVPAIQEAAKPAKSAKKK